MKIEIESALYVWDNGMSEMYVRLVNSLVLAHNEQDVRRKMENLSSHSGFSDFFAYGYGRNHLWIKQIHSYGGIADNRLLIVRF